MASGFFRKIQDSIYGPDFYRKLREKPFAYSLRYFLTLSLLLAVIGTVLFAVRVIPAVNTFVIDIGPQIATNYPEDLIVTIGKETLTSNTEGPAFIRLPESEFTTRLDTGHTIPENLAVVDPTAPPTVEKLREYSTLILATRDTLVYDTGNGAEFSSYGKFSDTTLTKDTVRTFFDRLSRFAFFIASLAVGGVFIFIFAFFAGKLLYLVPGALVILLIAKIRRTPADYAYAYRLGLHIITPAILVQSLLAAYGTRVPYLFTAIFLLAAVANFPAIRKSQEVETKDSEPPEAITQ